MDHGALVLIEEDGEIGAFHARVVVHLGLPVILDVRGGQVGCGARGGDASQFDDAVRLGAVQLLLGRGARDAIVSHFFPMVPTAAGDGKLFQNSTVPRSGVDHHGGRVLQGVKEKLVVLVRVNAATLLEESKQ